MVPGVIVAAPASGAGKTTLTLGLLRHFSRAGTAVGSVKIGPDYIDPAFHAAATGRPSRNIDVWAMRPETIARVIDATAEGAELVIGEGTMGLFDGATDGTGSTADAALAIGWPIVLVVDARGQAASAAALIQGFMNHRPGVNIAGVIFNQVGGTGHVRILNDACAPLGLKQLGFVPRNLECALPSRHLGLVQAGEHPELEEFLDRAATMIGSHVDTDLLLSLARPTQMERGSRMGGHLRPLGQRVAVACDAAFGFAYPHLLDDWRAAGADIQMFSPLADESPSSSVDAIYLPGGYPELHAGQLAANQTFLTGLRRAGEAGVSVYGECGGYMVLGASLTDADGVAHRMADLLPVETTFASRRLHLGYRNMETCVESPLGPAGQRFAGHEFHFASVIRERGNTPLFAARDARGTPQGGHGAVRGLVAGSFLHVIDSR